MPVGEGYWVSAISGEVLPVYEHAHEVATNPERFGLRKADVAGLLPASPKDRERLVRKAMRKGWIRVRADRARVVAEFDWSPLDDVLAYLIPWLSENFGPLTKVELHDMARRRHYEGTVEELADPERVTAVVGVTERRMLNGLLKRLVREVGR